MSADPHPLTQWVANHPALWGLASGLALLGVAVGLFGLDFWLVWTLVAVAFGASNGLMWRHDGPALAWRRRFLERHPPRA